MTMTMKPIVNITRAEAAGNRYSVMGLCVHAAKDSGWDNHRIDAMLDDLLLIQDYTAFLARVADQFEVR